MVAPKIENLIKNDSFIRRAYDLAKRAHSGQKRKSGEPYFNHALAPGETVASWGLDNVSIAAD